ncbi:MAG: hypothetical protein DGJ47_000137 [Rickettsiaceae bacterium]
MTIISPSILAANFLKLEEEIKAVEQAGANMLHIDIMDGHYVPNLSFGPNITKQIKSVTKLPLDVHLMIEKPERWIKHYVEAGADIITIHPNSTKHLDRTLSEIKQHGCKAGVALLPSDNLDILEYVIGKIDLILVMSVNPGFGGQKFLPNQLKKISNIRQIIDTKDIILSVDGGINDQTAPNCIANGADMLVAGSYIFSGDYAEKIAKLRL